jgi:hypothetical protein
VRNRQFFFLFIFFILVSASCSRAVSNTEKIDARIKRAIDSWVDPKSFDSCITGFKLLVDAVIIAAPATGFQAEFKENMSKAKKLFNSSSVLNLEGFALLNDSYRMINSGKDFQMPGDLSNPDDVLKYASQRAEKAREHLKQGQTRECVKILLEIVIMYVTPVKTVS